MNRHRDRVLAAANACSRKCENVRSRYYGKTAMDDETLNLSIRKFLKMVGINSQRTIEQAVAKAMADRAIGGSESFPASMRLQVAGLSVDVVFEGEIELQ